MSFSYSFLHSAVFYDRSVASSKAALHPVQSSASPFNFQYPLVFLRSFGSCLRLLPRLPITPILPSIFSSIMCFKRQFLPRIWQIWLAFYFIFIVCRIFPFGVYVCSDELKSAFEHPKGRNRLGNEDSKWVLNKMQGCVYRIRMTREWIQLLAFVNTSLNLRIWLLVPGGKGITVFWNTQNDSRNETASYHWRLEEVAFRTSYVTASGVNENWTFWPYELPAASQDRLCFVGWVRVYPYE